MTFANCFLYNGENSHVGRMCKHVQDEFLRHYEQLNMNFYLPSADCEGAAIKDLPDDDEDDDDEGNGEEAKEEDA